MTEKLSPRKEKMKCPMCGGEFIPESFHTERTVFDYHKGSIGNPFVPYNNVIGQLKITPSNLILKSWIAICPMCNYILRFAAEIGKKKLLVGEKKQGIRSYSEFNKQYIYEFFNLSKPYMDHADYIQDKIDELINKIKIELEKFDVAGWGDLYKAWTQRKEIDSFKFLIKFMSKLEKYCESCDAELNGKDMPTKIKTLDLSSDLENELVEINKIRNKIVHGDYHLNQDDEKKIDNLYSKLVYELFLKSLKPLNLNNIQIEQEHSFIKIEDLHREIYLFLHTEIGEMLRFKDYHNSFLKPLINELGIKVKGVNI